LQQQQTIESYACIATHMQVLLNQVTKKEKETFIAMCRWLVIQSLQTQKPLDEAGFDLFFSLCLHAFCVCLINTLNKCHLN